MKPKNRVMCPDCGRQKMLFETKEKAMNFIKFNGDEISNGKKIRWYYCPACCGYHITSKPYSKKYEGRTDKLIDAYKKQKKAMDELERSQLKHKRETNIVNKAYKKYMMDNKYDNVNDFIKHLYPNMNPSEIDSIIKRIIHRKNDETLKYWKDLSKEEKDALTTEIAKRAVNMNMDLDRSFHIWVKREYKMIPDGCVSTIKGKCVMIRNEMG